MPKLRNGSKPDSNPGSLDCELGILPLSQIVELDCVAVHETPGSEYQYEEII